jgi:hypothetical protein
MQVDLTMDESQGDMGAPAAVGGGAAAIISVEDEGAPAAGDDGAPGAAGDEEATQAADDNVMEVWAVAAELVAKGKKLQAVPHNLDDLEVFVKQRSGVL